MPIYDWTLVFFSFVHPMLHRGFLLLMAEILHRLGCIKPVVNNGSKLPTSTGERRISEPSTVLHNPIVSNSLGPSHQTAHKVWLWLDPALRGLVVLDHDVCALPFTLGPAPCEFLVVFFHPPQCLGMISRQTIIITTKSPTPCINVFLLIFLCTKGDIEPW